MSRKRDGAKVVGVGAAACAACCAGPILGALAAIGLTTFAGVLLFGAAGLLIASLAIVVILRRRRQTATASCNTSPVPDATPVQLSKVPSPSTSP